MASLDALTWPLPRLGEAIEALARASGLARHARLAVPPDAPRNNHPAPEHWIEAAARRLDLEAESIDVTYARLEPFLRGAGPALCQIVRPRGPVFLALLKTGRRTVVVLASDRQRHRVPLARVASALRRGTEAELAPEVARLLADAGIEPARRLRARAAFLHDQLGSTPIRGCWLLRLPAHASFRRQLSQARLPRYLLGFSVSYAVYAAVWATAWWIVGRAAFQGRFDPGAMLAWTFLLFTLAPLLVMTTWSQGMFTIGTAALLKRRLLDGALKLDPDQTRHQGVGQHLARVLESDAIESLALMGGFSALAAAPELVLAVAIFAVTGQAIHFVFLAVTLLVIGLAARRHFVRERRWTEARLAMTHDLVERMVGHRTRLAQATNGDSSGAEDEALDQYLEHSRRMDRTELFLWMIPRGWVLLAILGLAPAFIAARLSPESLAVILGATLLAHGGLVKLTAGLIHLMGAGIAWAQVAPLLRAAARRESVAPPDPDLVTGVTPSASQNGDLVRADHLSYRFAGRAKPILRDLSLRLSRGDRTLLTGPSGSGKSTLVSLLTGLRTPRSGLLLLDGLDRPTLGSDGWRRRVVAATQFHENHVFTESLAFNLLMGRRWPPREEDLALAESVCRRLGLGDLLERMPGGLFQLVGETGWQLSHGERSRVFMARALLQGADLVILDESFAELDPESLRGCLREMAALAPTLLVITHA